MADQPLDFQTLCRSTQDLSIWEALKARNFKTAMQNVDKRIKKDAKSNAYLVALKTLIMSQLPSMSDRSLALTHIEELLEGNPAMTDLDAIHLYDIAFEKLLPQSRESWASIIGELRWRSVKSDPRNEDSGTECFKTCLLNGDLDHAVKIATSLEKAFPKKHEYAFWQITTMFLYSNSPKCPEKQKEIWCRLALGQIEKLAAATIRAGKAGDQLPLRSIQTPQEILLLHLIEETRGRSEERLEYLKDPHIGPESSVAKEEWQLWIDKLNLMRDLQQWPELFETTSDLLKRARTKDARGQMRESRYNDFLIWKHFNESAKKINEERVVQEVSSELEMHLNPSSGIDKPWRRNAAIIWLDSMLCRASLDCNETSGKRSSFSPVSALIKHLQSYGNTSVAYEDIRPHVENLGFNQCNQLLEVLLENNLVSPLDLGRIPTEAGRNSLAPKNEDFASVEGILRLVNTQKLVYLLASCIPEAHRTSFSAREKLCIVCFNPCGIFCDICLGRLALSAMQSYGKAFKDDRKVTPTLLPTDRHPADDLCIVSAMCLIKLSASVDVGSDSLSDPGISYILQVALLLEFAWSQSKANFQILLLLVKVYCRLGCGSLAMRAYQRLGVKQIQHSTLSYIVFDRISSLHPHAFSHNPDQTSEIQSPLDNLKDQQKFYRSAHLQSNKNIWKSFRLGSYSSVIGIAEFSESLQRSMAKAMSVVESRKILRLVAPNSPLPSGLDALSVELDRQESGLFDSSDNSSFPDFEANGNSRLREFFGPLHKGQCNERSQADLVSEKLRSLVDVISEPGSNTDTLLIWLRNYLDPGSLKIRHEHRAAKGTYFTGSERCSMEALEDLAFLLLAALENSQDAKVWNLHNTHLYEKLEKQLQQVGNIEESEPAFQLTLHLLYTSYDLVTLVDEVMRYIWKTPAAFKVQQDLDQSVASALTRLREAILTKSTNIRMSLNESGWMDKVLERLTLDSATRKAATQGSVPVILTQVVGENFMEEWIGHVVESWKDSVIGFSYFRST